MLTPQDYARAQNILDKEIPHYRKAYSDRTAWFMAYMSELAYIKFDRPIIHKNVTLHFMKQILKETSTPEDAAQKITEVVQKIYDQDHAKTLRQSFKAD